MKSPFDVLLSDRWLPSWRAGQPYTLARHIARLEKRQREGHQPVFVESIAEAAVYSAQIEGVELDVDTYWKYRGAGGVSPSRSYSQVRDLVAAYDFARQHVPSLPNLLTAHGLLARTLTPDAAGQVRTQGVGVFSGKTAIYSAPPAALALADLERLFAELTALRGAGRAGGVPADAAFYYAAQAHLRLAEIHPFADGNGRAARLLEKWVLASLTSPAAWLLQSERYYRRHLPQYYDCLRIGPTYARRTEGSLPFLLLLPHAVRLR